MVYVAQKQQSLFIDSDDYALENNPDVIFIKILNRFDFRLFHEEEKLYYEALADFNKKLAEKRKEKEQGNNTTNEPAGIKDDAYQGLLFQYINNEHPNQKTILFEIPSVDMENLDIDEILRNHNGAGRKPKDFYSLVNAFLLVSYMGLDNSPATVHSQLINNPSFARKCGFQYIVNVENKSDRDNIPSLRKLEQFDQIMNAYGIWDKMKWKMVNHNIDNGTVKIEKDLAFDTTHVESYSSFTTVEEKNKNKKEKKQKKAVCKLSKRCSCSNKETCEHPWEETDQGSGVVVKNNNKMYWAHKASVVGFPASQIPIDAVAVNYASTNDGKTLKPHTQRLRKNVPVVVENTERVLVDGAYNTPDNRDYVRNTLGAEIYSPINPGNIKVPSAKGIRGIDHFTKNGVPICDASFALEMKGKDEFRHQYMWGPPTLDGQQAVCATCIFKEQCCPSGQGRTLRVDAADFPQIDWKNPQHLLRWKHHYNKRSAIERIIKVIKVDYSAERFNKRDNLNFQGHLDKSILAIHMYLSIRQ
jgi:hypothetical protein